MSRPRRFRHLPLAAALAVTAALAACGPTTTRPERVTIPPRARFGQVADSLKAHGVIRSTLAFKLRARLRGIDRQIHAGVYEFPAGASESTVLDMLAQGKVAAVRLTIPEGLTMFDVAALAQERLGIPADSFLAVARDSVFADSLGLASPTLEGYLWPDTYQMAPGIGARELAGILVKAFESAWQPTWNAQLDSLRVDRRGLLAMASIVEGEAKVDSERETIAGVYWNRLRRGMPLQADPTVQYAITVRTGKRKPRLYEKDYQTPSPYNTYLHPGLPPGPVSSPGRRSIEAALHPAAVPYYFFVASPDGHHTFTRTFDEHLRAVARARKARDAARPAGGGN